jgi:hypothetical protein
MNTETKPAREVPITATTTKGTYDGRELTRTCLRPGAYDAYNKPSLIGDKRLPHMGGK